MTIVTKYTETEILVDIVTKEGIFIETMTVTKLSNKIGTSSGTIYTVINRKLKNKSFYSSTIKSTKEKIYYKRHKKDE